MVEIRSKPREKILFNNSPNWIQEKEEKLKRLNKIKKNIIYEGTSKEELKKLRKDLKNIKSSTTN